MVKCNNERLILEGLRLVYAALLQVNVQEIARPDHVVHYQKAADRLWRMGRHGEAAVEHTRFPTAASQLTVEAQFKATRSTLPYSVPGIGFVSVVIEMRGQSLPRDLPSDLREWVSRPGWWDIEGQAESPLRRTGLRTTIDRRRTGRDRVVWRLSGQRDNAVERMNATLIEADEKFRLHPGARRIVALESDDFQNVSRPTFEAWVSESDASLLGRIDDLWFADTCVDYEFQFNPIRSTDSRVGSLQFASWAPGALDASLTRLQ